MKKLLALLSLLLIVSTILPQSISFASENSEQESTLNEEYEYIYEDGLIVSNVELTQENIDFVLSMLEMGNSNEDIIIEPFSEDPGGGNGIVIDGPYYKTWTNVEFRALIAGAQTWLGQKFPKLPAWVNVSLAGAAFLASESTTTTYAGAWTWKSYDSYYNKYRYYSTLVHYYHSNYTKPIRVAVEELENY
ncbi:hypothetical protein AMS60_18685 [Bacillus sp. FJAT-21945]|nr:hypothetical protein AMS60_18685 [Bacillus sp. FJAT-21945]